MSQDSRRERDHEDRATLQSGGIACASVCGSPAVLDSGMACHTEAWKLWCP